MKLQSYTITQGRDRAPARAMLKGIGFTDEDLAKPIIGVANTWIETMPCNYNLRELAVKVKEGIRAAGGTPMEFNTIAISRRRHHGDRRDEDVAGEPRGDRRFHRAAGARAHVRRRGGAGGLRQDDSRRGHGAAAAERPRRDSVRRHILPGRHNGHDITHSGRVRSGGRATPPAGSTTPSCAISKTTPAPARAPAAASSRPTPWPP